MSADFVLGTYFGIIMTSLAWVAVRLLENRR